MSDLPITMTPQALEMLSQKIAETSGAIGIRLRIGQTGCSGHSYHMEHVMDGDDVSADDALEVDGVTLYIPKAQSWMLFGMEIGYETGETNAGFTFINPNETARCGCGESFSIDRPPQADGAEGEI